VKVKKFHGVHGVVCTRRGMCSVTVLTAVFALIAIRKRTSLFVAYGGSGQPKK
jgi:hypothetical protein